MRANRAEVEEHAVVVSVSATRSLMTALTWLGIWSVPMLAVAAFDSQGLLLDIGIFFSKLAVVTFGGAYAVLAYLGQDVVGQFGWLSAGEMMDGLGLAETTPGPLILVNEFVGFLAAFREGGIWYGLLGAVVTLWVTFTPCFLWIFVGAPYIDWIGTQPGLRGALAAITAAVVGVILNLSIWFALHVFFAQVSAQNYGPLVVWQPELDSLDWRVIVLALLSAVMLFRLHWSISRVLLLVSILGVALSALVN
jgi:chromate transporter